MTLTLPNLISLLRLFLVPLIIWLLVTHRYPLAFLFFTVAAVSDLLDGLLARLLKSQSIVGRYLDPLADKTLLVGVFLTLGLKGLIPAWLVILVIFRDFIILGGALLTLFSHIRFEISPLWISKINTVFQLILVTFLLAQISFGKEYPALNIIMFIAIGITTLWSGGAYVKKWVKASSIQESPPQ